MASPPLGPKNPSATFYWNDWENDEALKACSLAAQGLWMRLLCIAARSPEPGVVQIGSLDFSLPGGLPRIAAAAGRSLEEVAPLIDELMSSGAADLDRKKRIICRRMVRAAALHEKRSAAGKSGADVTNRKKRESEELPQQKAGKGPGKPSANDPALHTSRLHASDPDVTTTESVAHEAGLDKTANGADAPPGNDVKAAIFGAGLKWFMHNTGATESACRSFLGQLIAQHGEAKTASVLMAAERAKPVDPRAWMKRNIEGVHNGPRPRNREAEGVGGESATTAGVAAAFARRSV